MPYYLYLFSVCMLRKSAKIEESSVLNFVFYAERERVREEPSFNLTTISVIRHMLVGDSVL